MRLLGHWRPRLNVYRKLAYIACPHFEVVPNKEVFMPHLLIDPEKPTAARGAPPGEGLIGKCKV